MPAEQIHIAVGPQETTGVLLERAAALPNGAAVRLELPPGALALRTLADFDRVRKLAEAHRWQLTVVSSDSAFLVRARIFGFRTEMLSEEPAPPAPAGEAPPDAVPTGPVAPPAP